MVEREGRGMVIDNVLRLPFAVCITVAGAGANMFYGFIDTEIVGSQTRFFFRYSNPSGIRREDVVLRTISTRLGTVHGHSHTSNCNIITTAELTSS
jgi:hypothetical protein